MGRCFDSNLCEQINGVKLTSLAMRLGKSSHKDPVPNFLANLTGFGNVTSQWGGVIKSTDVAKRSYFLTAFRHRLTGTPKPHVPWTQGSNPPTQEECGYDQNYQSGPYDPTMDKWLILNPQAPSTNFGPLTSDYYKSCFYQHGNALTYWAPLNRGDYEDMSWNLNKLKLGQASVNTN